MADTFFENSKRERGRVKHAILQYYLGGYFAKLGQTKNSNIRRVIYIDGFAGPGKYTFDGGEEDGSPIIAYKTVMEHNLFKNFNKPIHLIFIDNEERYISELETNLQKCQEEILKGKTKTEINRVNALIKVETICGDFEQIIEDMLNWEDFFKQPMLVFADPFGIENTPNKLLKCLIFRPYTELFINVMYSSCNRKVTGEKYKTKFSTFFGKNYSEFEKKSENTNKSKAEIFDEEYIKNLTDNSEDIFHHIFAIKNNINRNIYQLVFFTTHFAGLETMKRALVNNSQNSTNYVYSEWDANNPEKAKNHKMTDREILAEVIDSIKQKFEGQSVSGYRIARFVWEETPHIFNLRRELKNDLKGFIAKSNTNKFDEMQFAFSKIDQGLETGVTSLNIN